MPRKVKDKKPPDGYEWCGWQGYGGGANYEDIGCANGRCVDLDSCDKPGGPCSETGDTCPNCGGTGVVEVGRPVRGPMALVRQREQESLCDDIINIAPDGDTNAREWATEVCKKVEQVFGLIRRLEEKPAPSTDAGGAA